MAALNFPANPTNGQTYENYVYDGTDGVWKRISPGGTLGNIDDVTINAPADGQALVYDSSAGDWVNETLALTSTIEDLTDTTISSPSEGDVMVYDGSSWINTPDTSGNAIINGDFGVWQRGTSFTTTATSYSADRFSVLAGGATNATVSRQSFTPADIEVVGYGDAEYYARVTSNGSISGTFNFVQKIEDVRSFAGQTVTLSFWGKASSVTTVKTGYRQNFGSGGSSTVTNLEDVTFSTSWQRFTRTVNLNSLAGKTVGSNSYLQFEIINAFNVGTAIDGVDFDIWGVQLEAGSVATPFRLAGGGSKAAELALCQRYYYLHSSQNLGWRLIGVGTSTTGTRLRTLVYLKAQMRTTPSLVQGSGTNYYEFDGRTSSGNWSSFDGLTLQTPNIVGLDKDGLSISDGAAFVYTKTAGAFIALDAEL